jgi:chromosome partitioning protein
MAKIISLVNQKGGVGKTTTAVNLSASLAGAGKFVLLVDLDPQANATSGLGVDPRSIEKSLYHSMVLGDHPSQHIIKLNTFGHSLLPSNRDLAGATVELVNLENREYRLYNVLRHIRTEYDYIIIDSPPSLGPLTINGLVASDEVIIPVQCEYYALEGLSQLLETINLVKDNLQPDLKVMGALLTMFDRRNRLSYQVVREVKDHFPGRVFEAVIPRSVRLAEAPSFGKSIFDFDLFSRGAKSYKNLAAEILRLEKEGESDFHL